ncbi:hypothetical protein [Filifactor alocis]
MKSNRINSGRLTKVYQNELCNGVNIHRAFAKLKEYEDTGMLPHEIFGLLQMIENLQNRIKKLESW